METEIPQIYICYIARKISKYLFIPPIFPLENLSESTKLNPQQALSGSVAQLRSMDHKRGKDENEVLITIYLKRAAGQETELYLNIETKPKQTSLS